MVKWEYIVGVQLGRPREVGTQFYLKRKEAIEAPSTGSTEKKAVLLAKQAEKYFKDNDFEKTLQNLKELQQLVGKKNSET